MSSEPTPLHVEARGATTGPDSDTFLLIHGFGASSYTWRHWAPYLESRGRVVLVDMKGFGSSDKTTRGRFDPEHQAELIRELVDRLDPKHLTLIGHSLGGGVALIAAVEMAARGDSRLERLVLVSSPAYPQRLPPFVTLARYPRFSQLLVKLAGAPQISRRVLRSIVYDPATVDDEQVLAYAAPLRSSAGVRGMLEAARAIVPTDLDALTRRYPEVNAPTLLLWGRHDRVIPATIGERLHRALPNATLEIMEQCGHIPHEECPERSLRILKSFLEG